MERRARRVSLTSTSWISLGALSGSLGRLLDCLGALLGPSCLLGRLGVISGASKPPFGRCEDPEYECAKIRVCRKDRKT
eukprot:7992697-Pyramimonas_sp.AAC.1